MRFIELLRKAIAQPNRIHPFIRHKSIRSALSFNANFQQLVHDKKCDVINEDWDNLIILDGCRYDTFKQNCQIKGKLESRISLGSESWEFLRQNFQGKELHDTIYITANPHAPKLENNIFYRSINVLDSLWDPETKTVLPGDLAEKALEVAEEDKRIIIHFMQPHFPFIGPLGQNISHKGINSHTNVDSDDNHIWHALERGEINTDIELVREAYRENLRIVLSVVSDLIHHISGKTVITSDHGNLLGEPSWPIPVRGYGHPKGTHVTSLVKVPWLIIDSEQRKEWVPENPVKKQEPEDEVVSQRLRKLGYID